MKKVFIYSLMAVALAAVSCNTAKLDPLENIYPEATVVTLTTITNSQSVKDAEGRRVFDLDLTDGTTPIHFTFIGSKYYLSAGPYVQAPDATAKDGNFVVEKTTVGGKAVKSGTITVNKNGESNYSLYGVLFMSDGTIYKPSWKGTLSYVKEPLPPLGYTFTIADPADVTDANNATVADVKSNVVTLNALEGGAFQAQFNLILSEGKTDITGHYTVKEYAANDHAAGNGFDLGVYFGMAPGAYVIGSYYMDGETAVMINAGDSFDIYVDEGLYVFEGNGYQYVAKPYEKPATPDTPAVTTVTLDTFLGLTDYTAFGAALVGLDLGTAGINYTPADFAAWKFSPDYLGTGDVLKVEFYSADGTVAPGTYKPCADPDNLAEGEFKIGSAAGGSCVFSVADDKVVDGSTQYITDGTIVVTQKGKTYTIEVKATGISAKFVGKLSNEPETVGLTDFLSFTSYAGYGVALAGAELATPGFSYTANVDWTTWQVTYDFSGDGAFLKLELYTEGDTFAPGTYTPSTDPNNVGAGEFKTGSEAGGTTWSVVENNEIKSKPVTDGTVVVEQDGCHYIITLTSSTVVARYVGKLSE